MKRWMAFVSALFALVLTACSASSTAPDSKPEGRQTQQSGLPTREADLIVSVAASLKDALQEIKDAYEQEHPDITLSFNFGGSGKLMQQIRQGAPVDLFLSASQTDMNKLEEEQLILSETRTDFARNSLVLVTHASDPAAISSFAELDNPTIAHIATGEPETVPAGRYSKEVLEKLQLWDRISPRLIFASDVRQVLAYVEAGNAEAGIVYATDAALSEKVKVLATANPDWHEPIVYPGAVVAASENREAAEAFLAYLKSERGKQVLEKYGFQ
jgi:molybdate transport system substrate-binding protein